MPPMGSGRIRLIQLNGLILAILLIVISPILQNASARAENRSLVLAPTQVPGHWEYVSSDTRDKFYSDWAPGSSWSPSYGGNSSGGTIIDQNGSDSVQVTTHCSWSVPGDGQTLMPGQAFQVSVTVSSTVTGLTPAANLSGQDSINVFGFGTTIANAKDNYKVSGEKTVSAQASNGGSVTVPGGSSGQNQKITFSCLVDAGMGTAFTDWFYEWVEGPTPTASESPTITPTKSTPTISLTPTITLTPTLTLTPTITPTPGPGGDTGGLADTLAALGLSAAVIGSILATLGLLGILFGRGKKGDKPVKAGVPPPPPPQPMRYVLRASAAAVDVYPDQAAYVTFAAWRIPPEGGEAAAAIEAVVQVLVPASPAGLVASPTSGMCSLVSLFSVPQPRQCASLNVLATASIAGRVVAQTNVLVRILPLYELELKWEDPAQPAVDVDGREVRAWAMVTATPPDPEAAPDVLAGQIDISVGGANREWIRLPLQSYIQYEKQWVMVAAVSPAPGATLSPGNPVLVAQFNRGRQPLTARLPVPLNSELGLGAWASGKKLAEARYNESTDPPAWMFPDLTVYFHPLQDDNKIAVPGFGSNIQSPEFIQEPPDLLEISDYGEDGALPGRYSAQVALKEGVDLEKVFGPDLTELNAQVQVIVKVTAETGKVYTANVTYQICPTVELVIQQGNEDGSERADRHTYKDNELTALQFVADAEDNLVITAYLRRTDWPAAASRVVPFGSLQQANLAGKTAAEFRLGFSDQEDDEEAEAFSPVPEVPGRWYTFVRSMKPLLLTADRRATTLNLNISGELKGAPPNYRAKNTDFSTTGLSAKQELVPLYIYLKLWVIPGKQRETSTVGALTMIVKADGSVIIAPKYTLDEIGKIERVGSTSQGDRVMSAATPAAKKAQYAAFEDAPDGDLFREPIDYPLELEVRSEAFNVEARPLDKLDVSTLQTNPCPAWLHAWKLWYKGLNWDTVIPDNKAKFSVLCRIGDSDEAVAFRVDVGENLKVMWADFDAARPSLDLDNPEIHGDSPFLWLLSIRRELFGWWYDLRNLFIRPLLYAPLPPDDPWERYLCAALTQRILNYFIPRRMGIKNPDIALKMNGIEFLGYAVYLPGGIGYHSWAGFYLSGSDPLKDAIYMDPWWNQKWDDDASKFDYGYKKQFTKFTLTAILVATELILIGRAIYGAVQLRQGLFMNVPTFEDVLFWMKNIVKDLAKWLAGILTGEQFVLSIDRNLEWKGCFDGESRYENNNELRLFEYYKNELLGKPLPPITPEPW